MLIPLPPREVYPVSWAGTASTKRLTGLDIRLTRELLTIDF